MEKVIDFTKYKENKQVENVAESLVTRACLQSLFDITQEINAVAGAWRSVSPLDGLKALSADGTENDNLYKLRSLLDIHSKNLIAVSRALDDVIVEPESEHRAELIREMGKISYKDDGGTIIAKHLEYMKNLLEE